MVRGACMFSQKKSNKSFDVLYPTVHPYFLLLLFALLYLMAYKIHTFFLLKSPFHLLFLLLGIIFLRSSQG